ncbi:unnamed protein product [Rotaria sordida]|uniref:Uncharacterized protein n=1 Tax=Rotaria sordida TaxID=392033 RepID=A0A813XS25_9BILA|nr:unnamed protein product [Rotaria sordida]
MPFEDSSPMHSAIDKNKQQHSCSKTIGLFIALISYILALTLIIDDLFFHSQIFGRILYHFHAHTAPLILSKKWIAPLWMIVYSLQIPWLFYAITTLCRRNGTCSDSDYLYKYPCPVSQIQLLTFSLGCWSHIIFLYLIQHQSNFLATIYIILGTMALIFCLITSIIHLHNYERELSTCHLFGDIWSIRIFVHNGLSVMLAWQVVLIVFSSLYAYNTLLLPSKTLNQINESTLNLIGLYLIGSICIIAIIYIILMLCLFSNTLYHVIAGWIFLVLLIFSYWYEDDHQTNFLLLILFYVLTALLLFIVFLHLVLTFFRYSGTTCSSVSSTVADPSTVTVRIESASTSDLNVQDVSTTSSSDDDDNNELKQQRRKQTLNDRLNYQTLSATSRRHTSALGTNRHKNSFDQKRPNRLSTDINSVRVPLSRPTTAVSLPAKSSASDNEWDLDSAQILVSSVQRRNPSCPSISPTLLRSKSSSQSPVLPTFIPQQAPPVFTTTSECLGTDFRPQLRRDIQRRSQSLAKQTLPMSNSASPTIPIVFLTNDVLLGSIRALQNERQLCKLSIDYLIDATNMRPDELARKANVGARLPCQCGHAHSRCTLTLEFDQPYLTNSTSTDSNNLSNSKIRELSRTQLGQLFSAVNRFILKAQQEEKRILIYGFELMPNSPLAIIAIQYLMLCDEQLTLTEAMHTVHRLFPMLPKEHQQFTTMEKRFQDYLKQLDRKTFPKNFLVNNINNDGGVSVSGNDYQRLSRDLSSETSEKRIIDNDNTPLTSWTTIPMPIVNDNPNQSPQLFTTRSAWDS